MIDVSSHEESCHSDICESSDALSGVRESLLCACDTPFLMLSYTLYCDAAGGDDHGYIVVAGYLSTYEKWCAFNQQWKWLLATYGLPYFHMKEFSQSTGPFESGRGDDPKRARFVAKAAAIIRDNVERSFVSLVDFEAFSEVNRVYELSEYAGCPYALAGISCASKARAVAWDANYVFETGDKGRGELMRLMERDGFPGPIFRPSRDKEVKGHTIRGLLPLQAADFAAYELRKAYKDDHRELWPFEKYRKSLQALTQVPSAENDWGCFTAQDLISMCKKQNVKRRM